jgi:hypothetical protein
MPKKNNIYKREDQGQKTFNIALAMQEKINPERVENFENQFKEEVAFPLDVQKMAETELGGVGAEAETASTSNPSRPRAYAVAYGSESRTLYVVFRDNTWWEYRNVPTDVWVGLRNAPSTGVYLRTSGLDAWPDMGPAIQENMSQGLRARLSEMAGMASKLQGA